MINVRTISALVIALVALSVAPARAALDIYYFEPFSLGDNAERQFVIGELNGQHGWNSIPGQAKIAQWGEAGRRYGAGCASRGPGFGFQTMMQSPKFAHIPAATGDDYVLTMLVGFADHDVTWYITPKNISNNSIVTRIKFAAGGDIEVLIPDGNGGGTFIPVPDLTWEPLRNYTLVIAAHDNGLLQLSFDNRDVIDFEAGTFIAGIEALAVETSNERAGRRMIIDKIKVRNGNLRR